MRELVGKELPMITAPPEKVRLMYEAVIAFLGENREVSLLKVADITGRAGIGKGTAYEYFSTKEEIITGALFYEYHNRIRSLANRMEALSGFREKMFCLMDWIEENCDFHITFVRLLQLGRGEEGICDSLKGQLSAEMLDAIWEYTVSGVDEILENGTKEGVIRETDIGKCRLAFASAMVEFAFTCSRGGPLERFCRVEAAEAREFVYESMVRALS